ncbi:MAG: hypothetical protein KFB95_03340 [Simkaniaceae bacterium]|nr:MAG: hypothetical protein KFB95_03340 [Simkaniaceae bacterium]
MVSKAIEQILDFEEDTRLASRDPLVREWNIEILDQIVQNLIADFPLRPSGEDLKVYGLLKKRMEHFSEEFEDERFRDHVSTLIKKIASYRSGRIHSVQGILRHPMTEKIVGFRGSLEENSPSWFRLKLIGYIRNELTPAILNVKTSGERDWLHPILENLVQIGQVLEPFDIDGSYDDEMRDSIKQFLFKGITTHQIYQNLLIYQKGTIDHSNVELCVEAADGINMFILDHLVPFLKDPDVEPSRLEVEIITNHLQILNDEFSIHQKNLFSPSINILKSFL